MRRSPRILALIGANAAAVSLTGLGVPTSSAAPAPVRNVYTPYLTGADGGEPPIG